MDHRQKTHTMIAVTLSLFLGLTSSTFSADIRRILESPVWITQKTIYVPPAVTENRPSLVTACMGPSVAAKDKGTIYRNSESEPHLKVNPTNYLNMIVAHHQDRISTSGGSVGIGVEYTLDGGKTWLPVNIPFTRCSGGHTGSGGPGDYERASDPWISFSSNGIAYLATIPFNNAENFKNSFTVATSYDGGQTWKGPIRIAEDLTDGLVNLYDGPKITADPTENNIVYLTANNYASIGNYQIMFSKSTDGGVNWSPLRNIGEYKPPVTPGHFRMEVIPKSLNYPQGILVGILIVDKTGETGNIDIEIMRSIDRGETWSKSSVIQHVYLSSLPLQEPLDPELKISFNAPGTLEADLAIDTSNGSMYAAWADARFSGKESIGAVMMTSKNGGATWSDPINILPNTPTLAQAAFERIAVTQNGRVGVLFYDFRYDKPDDSTYDADVFLTQFYPNKNNHLIKFISETRLTPNSFDVRQFVTRSTILSGYSGYFPGDYVGLSGAGNDFVAAYTVSNQNYSSPQNPIQMKTLLVDSVNHQDIVFSRVKYQELGAEGGDR